MTVRYSKSILVGLLTLLFTINLNLNGFAADQFNDGATNHLSSALLDEESLRFIIESCESGLDFKSIGQFKSFHAKFSSIDQEQMKSRKIPRRCRHSREAILELDSLIATKNVCDPAKIDALIAYHKKFLKNGGHLMYANSRPVIQKFFTKYATQVAYACKKNLIRNLELGRQELRERSKTFDEARDRVYHDEPSIKANVKLIEEQPDDPASTNLRPRDDAELTLDEYREALTKLRRPEDILTFERDECDRSGRRRIKVAKDKIDIFFKPALMCHQLARFYSGSALSIARLANHGYLATDEELDMKLADDPMVRDWIVAVQVCEPMMFMRAEKTEDNVTIVDTCAERVSSIEEMVFEDNFEDLDNDKLEEMLPRSEATREHAQKLMKSAMKKMAKANLLKRLNSGSGGALKRSGSFGKNIELIGTTLFGSSLGHIESQTNDRVAMSRRVAEQLIKDTLESSSAVQQQVSATTGSANKDDNEWIPDDKTLNSLIQMFDQSSSSQVKSGATGVEKAENDQAVAGFDPVTSLFSFLTVMVIMLTFEWLFFIVMTLAARICHRLYFNFDNLLTFPPKVLSWSDADFARFNDKIEKIDEDDLFDYDELNPEEQKQRDLLAKVFGRPPPMVFRD